MGKNNSKPTKEPSTTDKPPSSEEGGSTIEQKSKYGTIDPKVAKKFQEDTHFDQVEVRKLYDIFTATALEGKLDRNNFFASLSKLEQAGLKNLNDTPFGDRLFEMLDLNKDGVVDLQEFISGLSFLCKGTVEEKLELSFKAYDLDGNGYITKSELGTMFKHAWIAGFKALCTTTGNEELSMEDLHQFAEEMANLFADNAFETLDTNGDGKLSFEEFKEFAMAEPKITATLNGFKKEVVITFW